MMKKYQNEKVKRFWFLPPPSLRWTPGSTSSFFLKESFQSLSHFQHP